MNGYSYAMNILLPELKKKMKDMNGFAFNEGCKVARAVMYGKSPMIDICEVTAIKNGKIYLDNSKQAIRFPERLLIVEQDPLYRMVKNYQNAKEQDDSNEN